MINVMSEINTMIHEGKDPEYVTEQAQKQLDLEAKIASKAGLTGSLIKSAEGAMKKLGIESKIVNDAWKKL
jgi:predicted RNase H-related nuclease YkuK (DUF458 family)